ncbi:hypothetical protein [Belliella pelovolcani]|uniref:hypothetical protein n=1 Tax=Belliella pelovolcani TaxID=529505 RepID=UPI00391B96C9
MFKKMIFTLTMALGVALISNSQDASLAPSEQDCQPGGLANVYCLYWDVEYEVVSGFWWWSDPTIKITCKTGGEFKCENKSDNPV